MPKFLIKFGHLDIYFNRLIQIDKWYPSSKACSACGSIKKDLTLKDRTYICSECGVEIDRDLNASLNILRESKLISKSSGTPENLDKLARM